MMGTLTTARLQDLRNVRSEFRKICIERGLKMHRSKLVREGEIVFVPKEKAVSYATGYLTRLSKSSELT